MLDANYLYVIVGQPYRVQVIKSNLTFTEMKEFIENRCSIIHPDSYDKLFKMGIKEFINPKLMTLEDFGRYIPEILLIDPANI